MGGGGVSVRPDAKAGQAAAAREAAAALSPGSAASVSALPSTNHRAKKAPESQTRAAIDADPSAINRGLAPACPAINKGGAPAPSQTESPAMQPAAPTPSLLTGQGGNQNGRKHCTAAKPFSATAAAVEIRAATELAERARAASPRFGSSASCPDPSGASCPDPGSNWRGRLTADRTLTPTPATASPSAHSTACLAGYAGMPLSADEPPVAADAGEPRPVGQREAALAPFTPQLLLPPITLPPPLLTLPPPPPTRPPPPPPVTPQPLPPPFKTARTSATALPRWRETRQAGRAAQCTSRGSRVPPSSTA
eukprot:scaffold21737_cov114-Isochrysis_galbana.AAC.3